MNELGLNDAKAYFAAPAECIAAGVAVLVKDIMKSSGTGPGMQGPPQVLLLTPPPFLETATSVGWGFGGQTAKAQQFPALYDAVAEQEWPARVAALHLGSVAEVSPIDGIHFPGGESQARIAEAVEARVREMVGPP